MLYDKSLEKDNCGFGLIAHIEGEPSHKVVRTAIHALAVCSTVAPFLPMVKLATVAACCCKTGSFLPHRGGRARLAFSQKLRCRHAVPEPDPEKLPPHAASLKKNFSVKPCRLSAGAMCQPTKGAR